MLPRACTTSKAKVCMQTSTAAPSTILMPQGYITLIYNRYKSAQLTSILLGSTLTKPLSVSDAQLHQAMHVLSGELRVALAKQMSDGCCV